MVGPMQPTIRPELTCSSTGFLRPFILSSASSSSTRTWYRASETLSTLDRSTGAFNLYQLNALTHLRIAGVSGLVPLVIYMLTNHELNKLLQITVFTEVILSTLVQL